MRSPLGERLTAVMYELPGFNSVRAKTLSAESVMFTFSAFFWVASNLYR